MRTRGWSTSSPWRIAGWPARSIAAAPAANCASISAYATAWLPLVLRQAVSIWVTIAATASPTALSSSGISSTICIVVHPPSLGLLLPLRCHGSAPGSTALLSGSPRRAASPAQDRSHTQADGRYETVLDAQEGTGWLEDPPSHPILKDFDEVLQRWVIELLVRKVGTDHGSNLTWRLT